MHDDDWFPLSELTGRLGGLVWVEEQLAELLTSWAAVEASAPTAVHFRAAGHHHQWHADVVRRCLPTSPRLIEDDPVTAPTAGWKRTLAMLSELTDPNATVPRLKALVRVLDPWLEREIAVLGELARPVSDAPMMRWLRFVSLDHHDDGAATALLAASQSSKAVSVETHRLIAGLDLNATE